MASSVIGALRVNLGIDTAAFSDGLKSAGSKLGAFGAVLRKAIVPLVAVGTAAAVGLGAAVKSTVDAADEMSKAASKFGVPIEELSRLNYAAKLSDVSLDQLGTAVGKLSKNMVAAQGGVGIMADAFAKAGIAVKNADGTLRSSSDVLSDIADKFASMPDGAEKTALAMQLLGKSGAEMIPMLNGGAAALEKMKAEADTFGQVFTAEMGTNAEAFNDNMTRLGGAFGAVAADLTQKLLPYLVQFSDWMVQNGPRIANVVVGFVELGAAIIHAGQAVVNFVASFVEGIARFDAEVTGRIAALEDMLAALPATFAQIGRDIIEGLLAGLREKWESVKAWFGGLAESIPGWIKSPLGIHSPSTVFAEIGANIMQGLSGGLEAGQDDIRSGMDSFGNDIATQFAGILDGSVTFREALSNVLSSIGSDLLNAGIGSLFKGIPGFARGTSFAPGGLAMVGERGPELVNLPRGSRVTPNNQMAGGNVINFAPVIDARGADAAAVARIEAVQVQMAREFKTTFGARVQRAAADPRYRGAI